MKVGKAVWYVDYSTTTAGGGGAIWGGGNWVPFCVVSFGQGGPIGGGPPVA